MDDARRVREFWFGTAPLSAAALADNLRVWFSDASPQAISARDDLIRTEFGDLVGRATRGTLSAWADGPRRRLSLILLLDQFPRQLYRGTVQAYATDQPALSLALSGMQSGADAALEPVERIFFYMPLQHAESLDVQDESVAAFRRLVNEAPQSLRQSFDSTLEYALAHHAMIRKFGRFPQRNLVLGRETTMDEAAFLKTL